MYSSPDLQVCIRECRVSEKDELYVATLAPLRILRLLDLSALTILQRLGWQVVRQKGSHNIMTNQATLVRDIGGQFDDRFFSVQRFRMAKVIRCTENLLHDRYPQPALHASLWMLAEMGDDESRVGNGIGREGTCVLASYGGAQALGGLANGRRERNILLDVPELRHCIHAPS
jgi:HicA toxin of bacterial toxin-antitoxin,